MKFRDQYAFLSNMCPCEVVDEYGIKYKCVETAFQAAKTNNVQDRAFISNLNGPSAKKAGRRVKIIPNWDKERLNVMYRLLKQKFSNPELLSKLLYITGEIVEDNTWGDTFWGKCNGEGENHLGIMLMKIRDEALVLLCSGKIVLTHINHIKEAYCSTGFNELWLCSKLSLYLTDKKPENFKEHTHCPDLAPSSELQDIHETLRRKGQWNEDKLKYCFAPQYIKEMLSENCRAALNTLYNKVKQGNVIALAFGCEEDERLCPRSIIGGLLQGVGLTVVNSQNIVVDYKYYYDKYLEIKKYMEVEYHEH